MPEGGHVQSEMVKSRSFALASIGWLFFVCSLFPAVVILPLPLQTDTQPNALLLAALVFLVGRRVPLPLPVWGLLILFIGAVIVFIGGGATIDGARSLIGYTTVFVVAAATLVLASSGIRLSDKLLDYSVYIWTFVGAVQLFAWRPFMTFLVTASRGSEGRGVTSLSNEPSLYATTMIFFIIFYFFRERERSFPVLLCIVQIVLLSQSALGVLFVLIMLGLYMLLRFSAPVALIAVLLLVASMVGLVMYGGDFLAGTRIGGLLAILKDHPSQILKMDQSVSTRFAGIFYSIRGTIENIFLPHGFEIWKDYSHFQSLASKGALGETYRMDRIMSGYGSALFEMGWVGLTIPFLITVGIVKSMWRDGPPRALSLLLVIHLLLLTPVTLTLPLVGLLIGELFSRLPSRSLEPVLSASPA